MELEQVKDNTWVLKSWELIPVYRLDAHKCILLDTGLVEQREELQEALSALAMGEDYGYILRAKGMVPCDDGQTWLHFDLVPEEFQIREGGADSTGRVCVIGSELKEDQLEKLFLLA